MEGFEPTQDALNSLQSFLEDHLNKSQINISTSTIPAHEKNAYTTDEIGDLEEENRNNFTNASTNTLNAYFIVVDGEFSDANVLGIAYFNTSMALFGETVNSISGGVTQCPRVRRLKQRFCAMNLATRWDWSVTERQRNPITTNRARTAQRMAA